MSISQMVRDGLRRTGYTCTKDESWETFMESLRRSRHGFSLVGDLDPSYHNGDFADLLRGRLANSPLYRANILFPLEQGLDKLVKRLKSEHPQLVEVLTDDKHKEQLEVYWSERDIKPHFAMLDRVLMLDDVEAKLFGFIKLETVNGPPVTIIEEASPDQLREYQKIFEGMVRLPFIHRLIPSELRN